MLQMAAVFAEPERGMIRERVVAGLARAKEQGRTPSRRKTGKHQGGRQGASGGWHGHAEGGA